jgi:PBP1b-binding outer membrane lipoprotein LpoB
MARKFLLCSVIALFLVACSEKKDPQMAEAASIHNAAMAQLETLEGALDSLKKELESVKSGLSPTDSLKNKEIIAVIGLFDETSESIEKWEEDIVEVPGNEHHHHHGSGEHHEHKPAPNLTSEQQLKIQQLKKTELDSIANQAKIAIDKAGLLLKK